MRCLAPLPYDAAQLWREIDELEALLAGNDALKEREHIAPFFGERPQLSMGLGLANHDLATADLHAAELDLFGDYRADVAAGDSSRGAFTFIEFEDAHANSIFEPRPAEKHLRKWTRRFNHGFSQLVDWGWRLDAMWNTPDFRRICTAEPRTVTLLLVIGRNKDLEDTDIDRIRWFSQNIRIGRFHFACWTFDDVITLLRARSRYAASPGLPP